MLKPLLKPSMPLKKEKYPKKLLNLKLNNWKQRFKELKNLMMSEPLKLKLLKLKKKKTKMVKLML